MRHEGTVNGCFRQDAAGGLLIAAKRRRRLHTAFLLRRACFGKRGGHHSSHSSYLRRAYGGQNDRPGRLKTGFPFWEFCAFLRLPFSNLYQISIDFHLLQSAFTAHFRPFCGKSTQVPFNEQLTTNFRPFQSRSVKPSQGKSR